MLRTTLVLVCVLVVMTTGRPSIPQCLPEREVPANVVAAIGGGPSWELAADIDSDGDLDLVLSANSNASLAWYPNLDGNGMYGEPQMVSQSCTGASRIAAADLNGDNTTDLVASCGSTYVWFANTDGLGSFGPANTLSYTTPPPINPAVVVIADADDDGDADIMVIGSTSAIDLIVFENTDGLGSFAPGILPGIVTGTMGANANGAWIENMDNQSRPEILFPSTTVFITRTIYSVSVVRWEGGGSVVSLSGITTQSQPHIAPTDVDGDGWKDVVIARGTIVAWHRNLIGESPAGDLSFDDQPTPVDGATSGVFLIRGGDVDGDGASDICVLGDNGIVWFQNIDGQGREWLRSVVFAVPSTSVPLARFTLANLDNDDDLDFVVVDNQGVLFWLANGKDLPLLPSTVSNPIPSSSTVGSIITAGADFDADGDMDLAMASNALVWFRNTDGAGFFAEAQVVLSSASLTAIFTPDLDGDGHADIMGYDSALMSVLAFLNTDGAGTFAPLDLDLTLAGRTLFSIGLDDINGDGRIDVIASAQTGPQSFEVSTVWFANQGLVGSTLMWAPSVVLKAGRDEYATGDLDNDLDTDLIIVFRTSVRWFENVEGQGIVTTSSERTHDVGNNVHADQIVVADFDGDGKNDILARGQQIYLFTLAPSRDFVLNTTFSVGRTTTFEVADANGDGALDVIAVTDERRDNQIFIIAVFPQLLGQPGEGLAIGPTITTIVDYVQSQQALSMRALDVDSDGDADILISADTVAWYPSLVRGPFDAYVPTTHLLPREPSGNQCVVWNSGTCLASRMAKLSRCVRDTLVLPPGKYGCFRRRHLEVSYPLTLAGQVPGQVTFDCESGVLFEATVGDVLVGDVGLVNLTFSGTGAGSASLTGVPGLRAQGFGTRISITSSVVKGGVSQTSPERLGSGSGGCLLAWGGGSVVITDSTVANCSASISGGAVAGVGSGSEIRVVNSVVEGNSAGVGGGLAVGGGARMWVEGGAVVGNVAHNAGGGVWVQADAESVVFQGGVGVEGNVAPMGGGFAVARDAGFANPLFPVNDVPEGSMEGSRVVLMLDSVVGRGNRATNVGGFLFACDAKVNVTGLGTVWENNVALGTIEEAGSSGDAFLCGVEDGPLAGFVADRSRPEGIPWLNIDPTIFSSSLESSSSDGWKIHGPTSALGWVGEPSRRVEAGGAVVGVVEARDMFGGRVVYVNSIAVFGVEGPALLADVPVQRVVLGSGSVAAPQLALPVVEGADASLLPINATVSVSIAAAEGVRQVAPLLSWVEVTACAPGSGGVTGPDGTISCAVCAEGTATSSDEPSLAPCVTLSSCPSNTFRPAAASDNSTGGACVCLPGFWLEGGEVEGIPCNPCPKGGVCLGGSARPTAAPGFFPVSAGSTTFLACPNPEACAGGGQCQVGYRGRLCAQCADGYYTLRGQCLKCNTGVNTLVTVLLVLGALGVCGALFLFNLAEGLRYRFVAATIGFSSLQISAMYGQLELDWGGFAAVYFDVVSSVNLNVELTSPECSLASGTDAWVVKLVLTLILPVFVGLGLAAVGLVFGGLIKGGVGWFGGKTLAQLVPAGVRAWFQGLVLLYLPLTSAALSVFGCRRDEAGRWVLDADPARSCYTSSWWAGLFPLGLVATLVYAFALPGCLVWVLWRKRRTLDGVTFTLRFGFLVGRFRESEWWFEAAILARKLLVVVCMTFFFTEEGKANAAVFALLGSLVQLVYTWPYAAALHNGLAVIVLFATISILYAGTFADRTFRRVGVVGGIVVNVLAIVVGNALDVWRIVREEKEVEEEEFFQEGVFRMDSSVSEPAGLIDSSVFTSDVGVDGGEGSVASVQMALITDNTIIVDDE